MLGVKNYTQAYIDSCRARVDEDIACYREIVSAAAKQAAGDQLIADFESRYFAGQVILLDACFVHRLRTVEGKDGNPLNEVRVVTESLLNHAGVMTPEKTIKMPPEKSVLGIQYGEPIELTEEAFVRLSSAYFAAIEARFGLA